MGFLGGLLAWGGAAILALFGISGATNVFGDLLTGLESIFDRYAWAILLTFSFVLAMRLRRWRDA